MPPAVLAWLDYSEADQRRAREIVAMFLQRESRDELGLGGIRDALSDTVTGLTNGTTYTFRVRAVNAVGEGTATNDTSTELPAGGTSGSASGTGKDGGNNSDGYYTWQDGDRTMRVRLESGTEGSGDGARSPQPGDARQDNTEKSPPESCRTHQPQTNGIKTSLWNGLVETTAGQNTLLASHPNTRAVSGLLTL